MLVRRARIRPGNVGWIDGRRGPGTGAVAADRGRTAAVQRVTPPSRSLQSDSVLL